jgi:2-alkyl-3-oxoalkanoate reductase
VRVFVTGGSGFIGGALIRRLRSDGHEVRALVRSPQAEAAVAAAGAVPVRGDVAEPGPWQKDMGPAQAVVHAAALVADWGPRREFFRVNAGGTRNVLEGLKGWPGHFVHISSVAVHGWRPGIYDENSPASPGRHPYCRSKAAAETVVDLCARGGLRASIIRIAGVYGPGDPHFVQRFLDYAASGRIPIVGAGDQPSKMIFIDDVVEALMAMISRPGEPGARYLLNDPAVPNVGTMIRLAMKALGLAVPVRRVPEALALTAAYLAEARARLTGMSPLLTSYAVKAMGRRCFFSPEGTSRKLGWSPRTKAEDGIAKTVAWFREKSAMSPAPPPRPGAPR